MMGLLLCAHKHTHTHYTHVHTHVHSACTCAHIRVNEDDQALLVDRGGEDHWARQEQWFVTVLYITAILSTCRSMHGLNPQTVLYNAALIIVDL